MSKTEQEIAEGLKAGHKEAYVLLYRLYYADMCIVANRIVKDIVIAEELAQQTICKLWERRQTLHIPSHLGNYLFRAVSNAALNHIRDSKNTIDVESQFTMAVDSSCPAQQLVDSELARCIHQHIEALPEKTRNVFKMSRFDDLTYDEIADKIGMSVKTVEYHMSKALKALHENLKEFLLIALCFLSMLH